MDELCIVFAPNMWRSVHTSHVYQVCIKYEPSPHAYSYILLAFLLSKKHTTVQIHRLHVVPFNASSIANGEAVEDSMSKVPIKSTVQTMNQDIEQWQEAQIPLRETKGTHGNVMCGGC